ncbi:MAG: CoA transferase [SAR202 cluster bacterium]|jgi:crotonobetainyl-CoA:carnitine CoA-transferase CaiB-like acyl-CoA transferase|nr:CoA transferase [SAR202 cluster bacterium]
MTKLGANLGQDVSALSPYTILDLSEGGHNLCGRLLGDLGAHVIRVEPIGGSPTRLRGPFVKVGNSSSKGSLYWAAYNSNKIGITLDLESERGRAIFLDLVKKADAVLESYPPGYMEDLSLGYDVLKESNPGLVYTSITPFGENGPHSSFHSSDLISSAMGGMPYLSGDTDRPPVRISFPQAELNAGSQAFAGTMAALWHSRRSGKGQRVEISEQISVIWTLMNATTFPPLHRVDMQRAGSFRRRGPVDARHVFRCADGHVTLLPQAATLEKFMEWMTEEGHLPDDARGFEPAGWDVRANTSKDSDQIREFQRLEEIIELFLLSKKKAELFERAVSDGLLIAPCNTVADISESTQLKAREYWVDLYHPELEREIRHLGPPVKLTRTPGSTRIPSPSIGQNNQQVYSNLGIDSTEQSLLSSEGII